MITHRIISGLKIEQELKYRVRLRAHSPKSSEWDVLHLRQSPLDAACGLHCSLMAGMIVTGMTLELVHSVSRSTKPPAKKVWQSARTGYFRGTSPAAVRRILSAICKQVPVECPRGRRPEQIEKMVNAVEEDQVVLVMIGASARAQLHWVVLTGVEYTDDVPSALLGLDPNASPPVCSAFNWRMPLPKQKHVTCATTSGPDEMRQVQRAVIVRREQSKGAS